MPIPDTEQVAEAETQPAIPKPRASPIARLARVIGQSARFPGDSSRLGSGEKAALARMEAAAPRPHQVAALSRALIQAELEPEHWRPETWKRWALIAHGIALAGHAGQAPLGSQLCNASVSESRVSKLLTARGESLRQLIPPLMRLLASKEVSPNWIELGGLILNDDKDSRDAKEQAERFRLRIARYYFANARKSVNT